MTVVNDAAVSVLLRKFVKEIIIIRRTMKLISDTMKKRAVFANSRYLVFAVAMGCSSLVACSKCEDCQLNGNSETLCETEFDSPDAYDNAIADRESNGATCTSSGGF
jgi:hypothetical protein